MTDLGITLRCGDCLDILPELEPVDAIIADIPYGTTRCSWDEVIPFDAMWSAITPLTTRGTPVVLFGSEPFSSRLRLSNIKKFKYDWIWDKPKGTGFLNAKRQPMRNHEIISVFGEGLVNYYPQKTQGHSRKMSFRGKHLQTEVYGHMQNDYQYDSTERYPRSVQTFSSDTQNSSIHRTQKPLELMRYLVKTYSRPGDTVLDFTMGSGTTGVACVLEGRNFIGIEKDPEMYERASARIREAVAENA